MGLRRFALVAALTVSALVLAACQHPPPTGVPTPTGTFSYSVPGTSYVPMLDVYVPTTQAPPGGRPGIVLFHGGAWTGGTRALSNGGTTPSSVSQNGNSMSAQLVSALLKAGVVVVSADYTTAVSGSTSRDHPLQVLQAKQAVQWLVDHAAEYGVDPANVSVGGHSAGGHLAMMVAFTRDAGVVDGVDISLPGGDPSVKAVYPFAAPAQISSNDPVTSTARIPLFAGYAGYYHRSGDPLAVGDGGQPYLFMDALDPPACIFTIANDEVVNIGHYYAFQAAIQQARGTTSTAPAYHQHFAANPGYLSHHWILFSQELANGMTAQVTSPEPCPVAD